MATIRVEVQVRDDRHDYLPPDWREVDVIPDQGRSPRVELSEWLHETEPLPGRYRALTERGTHEAYYGPLAVAA